MTLKDKLKVPIHPFRTDRIAVKPWQLIIVAWLTVWSAAYMNDFWTNGLSVIFLSYHIQLWKLGALTTASIVGLVVFAPIFEEWIKNYVYRRTLPYQGFIVAFLFGFFEALEYWVLTPYIGVLDWKQLIFKFILPNHIIYFLVAFYFSDKLGNFTKKGQIASTIFHSLNNLAAVILSTSVILLIPYVKEIFMIQLGYDAAGLGVVYLAWRVIDRFHEFN